MITGEHFKLMKDGAVLANTGHFDVGWLIENSESFGEARPNVCDFKVEGRGSMFLQKKGRSTLGPLTITR